MTVARDIVIRAGQTFELSLPYAGTAGRGQRSHIRWSDGTATVVQILTHNGDANARVLFNGTDAIDITIGASVSAAWVVGAMRVEWVYDIEDYDLSDVDDVVITHSGKCIVYGNRTRESDITPSDQMPSGDGRYVRFDGEQGLTTEQQLQARENIDFAEAVRDAIGTALVAGSNITITVSDAGDTITITGTGGGVTDHGALTGLADDDHAQYHNDARGDARYQPLATVLTNTTASFTTADETKLDAIEALADVTDAGNVGSSIHGATEKTTPVDADTVPLIDSAASNVLKKLSWANIKATAKAYFDTLYATLSHDQGSDTITSTLLDVTGTTHTAAAGDDGKIYRFTHASGCAVTIPDTLTAGWSVGWAQVGNAQSTFTGSGSMVVTNRQSHTKTAGRYASGGLLVQATNSVYLFGDTGA